jgi:hypothetical protein
MSITNAGRDYICSAIIGSASPLFTSANSYIEVGSATTVFSATQTALGSVLASARMGMQSTYPSVSSNVISFRANFGTTDAQGAWNEWGVFNASAGGTMLNRKVESLGTKPGTQTWQFTVTLTLTVPAS